MKKPPLFFVKWLMLNLLFLGSLDSISQDEYNFLIGGHAYGDHLGTNDGLHPPFLTGLEEYLLVNNPDFIVLTGDIVRNGTSTQWNTVATELDDLNLSSYYVMGNHDNTDAGIDVFNEKHGNTYYSFMQGPDLFVVLDQEISFRSISSTQVDFLQSTLESSTYRHVFVFFHMLLWNGHEKYSNVNSNLGSQYSYMSPYSNYWEEIYPILNQYSDHDIYVITGDVGGRPNVISAYYDRCGHIRMIASGMGETPDENFMTVDVSDDEVAFELIALNSFVEMDALEDYTYNPPLVFDLFPQETAHLCEGEFITLEAVFENDFAFEWSLNDEPIDESSFLYTTNEAGLFSVTATDQTCVVTQVTEVILHEPITFVPTITSNENTLMCDCPELAQWYFNSVALENETNLSLNPTSNGEYSVTCNNAGCASEFSDQFVVSTASINSLYDQEITIYFEENSESIVVKNHQASAIINGYDVQGKRIFSYPANSQETQIAYPKTGLIFIQVISENGKFIQQMFIP